MYNNSIIFGDYFKKKMLEEIAEVTFHGYLHHTENSLSFNTASGTQIQTPISTLMKEQQTHRVQHLAPSLAQISFPTINFTWQHLHYLHSLSVVLERIQRNLMSQKDNPSKKPCKAEGKTPEMSWRNRGQRRENIRKFPDQLTWCLQLRTVRG